MEDLLVSKFTFWWIWIENSFFVFQMSDDKAWDQKSDEEKAIEYVQIFREVSEGFIRGYKEGDIRIEVQKGYIHCFSNFYNAKQMAN